MPLRHDEIMEVEAIVRKIVKEEIKKLKSGVTGEKPKTAGNDPIPDESKKVEEKPEPKTEKTIIINKTPKK